MNSKRLTRLPFLLLGMGCLLVGVLTGLTRAGVQVSASAASLSAIHSLFMISGFFGTVIGLERAVASQKGWPYLAPTMSGLGGLALFLGASDQVAMLLFSAASACFVAASMWVYQKQPAIHTRVLLIAAGLWLVGNLLSLTNDQFWVAIPYGLSFLILTIAGERLELTRFMAPQPNSRLYFVAITLLIIIGTAISGHSRFVANNWLGISYAGLALWLLRFDIARKTIYEVGITRFVAVCLLSGYVWLWVGGLLLTGLIDLGSYQRDAATHCIAIGFIFAMVIGHAPIIFPAVMRVPIPYSALFYGSLILIQAAVSIRVLAATLSNGVLRELGAILSAVAIASFILTLLWQIARGSVHRKQTL